MDNDSLWIGVQSLQGSCITALNVFRKVGNGFKLINVIEGPRAIQIYELLTREEVENADTKSNL